MICICYYISKENSLLLVILLFIGIRSLQQFARSPSMGAVHAEIIPNGEVAPECNSLYRNSDAFWACVFRSTTVDGLHPAGTCRMGDPRDRTTVVDPELR